MKKRSFAIVASCLICAVLMSGCFGSFSATRFLYNVNDSVMDDSMAGRFVKTLVMWCLTILPAYPIFIFGDAWILNIIEFFTGHPVIGDASYDVQDDGSILVHADTDTFRVIPVDDSRMVIEHNGTIVGDTLVNESSLKLTNYSDATVREIQLEQ